MTEQELTGKIDHFYPKGTAQQIAHLIFKYKITLKIVRPRKTFLGTCYRDKNLITINGDMPPYLFLLVTLHEMAHFLSFRNFGLKISPHGKEWKAQYSQMLNHFINMDTFPTGLKELIVKESKNPHASFSLKMIEETSKYSDK